MIKKITIFLLLFIAFSCGKKISESKAEKENKKIEENNLAEKYNRHVDFYNQIIKIDSHIGYYFEIAGKGEKLNKIKSEVPLPVIEQKFIDEIRNNTKIEGEFAELDDKSHVLATVLEGMKVLTDEMRDYYKDELYLKDGYKKGVEYHLKFIETAKKYNEVSRNYKSSFKEKASQKKRQNLETFKKEGKVIKYNLMLLMDSGEALLDEIQNQKLNAENFIEGNVDKFILQNEQLKASYNQLKISSEDKKTLENEGFHNSDFTSFLLYTERFIDSVDVLIAKMGSKEKIDKGILKNPTAVENTSGTPENIFNEYNYLVKEYNRLLGKK